MERLVLYLCGFWYWATRKYRTTHYEQVAELLDQAKLYLISDFTGRASTRDRGGLLPDQVEAISILDRQRMLVQETSSRLQTLSECVRMVTEELSQPTQAA